MEPISADLIKTRSGDDDAFARLLDAYSPMISSLASEFSKMYPSIDMSEDDLKQEAAIALYFAALSYTEGNNVTFGLYAKVCIKNRLLTYMRHCISKSLPQMLSECIDGCFEDKPVPPEDEPLNVIMSNENCDALRRKIKERLTGYEYSVFIMSAEGYSSADIARTCGKSVKSVYNTLQRARNKLKKLI